MAPLPPNSTGRLFIEYTSVGQEHVAILRLGTSSTFSDANTVYDAIAPLMAATMDNNDNITGARYAAPGSNLSFPVSVTPHAGTQLVSQVPGEKPSFYSFTGRSTGGRRVRFTVFTPWVNGETDGFRDDTPHANLQDILDELQSNALITAIDGGSPIWNTYVNYGYNSYFQRKQRRTG